MRKQGVKQKESRLCRIPPPDAVQLKKLHALAMTSGFPHTPCCKLWLDKVRHSASPGFRYLSRAPHLCVQPEKMRKALLCSWARLWALLNAAHCTRLHCISRMGAVQVPLLQAAPLHRMDRRRFSKTHGTPLEAHQQDLVSSVSLQYYSSSQY